MEGNRLLMLVFAKDTKGDITPKGMSQLHIHFPHRNTARPALPKERAGDDTICSTKCNFPRFAGGKKKSFLTTCNELLQPRLEAAARPS